MNLEVNLVPPGQISLCVSSLMKYLKKSEAWTRGRANVDDIIGFVYSGRMNLWLIYDPETKIAYGYLITEVKPYSRLTMLNVQYCAGEPQHMKLCEDKVWSIMESFAKDAGCAGIEFFGRPGWGPYAEKRGFNVRTHIYERFFT